jgi:hypothetical protein
MLKFKPEERISLDQIIQHPFFHNYSEENFAKMEISSDSFSNNNISNSTIFSS